MVKRIFVITIMFLLCFNISHVLADSHFDGDTVEVVTNKVTYNSYEPIMVVAKYTNVGESQLLALPSPGGLDARVIIRKVGALEGEPNDYEGKLEIVNKNFDGGNVSEHSVVAIAQKLIPAGKLTPGKFYQVTLIFQISSATQPPQIILSARSTTLISVK